MFLNIYNNQIPTEFILTSPSTRWRFRNKKNLLRQWRQKKSSWEM